MGNKLSQSDDLSGVDIGGYQISPSHANKEQVLRLWVDLFNVREDDSSTPPADTAAASAADLQWYKITDDVVPASITCTLEDPSTVYYIKAYNSQVEKICDVKIIQPGTKLKQPTESFIHFKDAITEKHWGFNFTSADDAAKFRDAVLAERRRVMLAKRYMTLTLPSLPKTSSFGTLRLGKKWKTGSARDGGGAKRSDSHELLSSLRLDGGRSSSGNSRDVSGIVTAPSYDFSLTTMSLDRREMRQKRQQPRAVTFCDIDENSGFRQNQPTRVDSRTLFAELSAIPSFTREQDVIAAPPELSSISELPADNTQHNTQNSNQTVRNESCSITESRPTDDNSAAESHIHHQISGIIPPTRDTLTTHTIQEESSDDDSDGDSASQCSSSPPPVSGDITEETTEDQTINPHSDTDYDKPATLSAAHLNAILFSCENISSASNASAASPDHKSTTRAETISEEEEEHDQIEPSNKHLDTDSSDVIAQSSSESEVILSGREEDSILSLPHHLSNSNINYSVNNNDSTLHKMLQSLPDLSETSNSSLFGIEAEAGDPSITAPLPQTQNNSPSNTLLLRRASNRGQSSTSIFRGSSRSKRSLVSTEPTDSCSSTADLNNHQNSTQACEDDHNVSLYQDSGFGGTVSTEKSLSIKSSKSRMSRQSSSAKSSSVMTRGGSESLCSSSASRSSRSSGVTQSSDHTQVKPFTLHSDEEEEDLGSDDDSLSNNSLSTRLPQSTGHPSSAAAQRVITKSNSSYSSLSHHRQSAGATRRTGWLEVKNWLMQQSKKRLTLANKRHWRRYWVTLRGTTLMFYACDDQATLGEDALPRHIIYIDGSIAQSVPEHPKRENIFSVSSAFGDAYLFQAPTQIDHDNWISSIHSSCASQHARQHGKTNPIKLLMSDINKLQQHITDDSKMKKMAELQLTIENDAKSRSAISNQIYSWQENLESYCMDQFRYKCYLSSLQGTELPNPKTILSSMSRSTKHKLGKLGILNATSFHSLICIRTSNAYNTYIDRKSKKGILSTLRQNSSQSRTKVTADTFLPPAVHSDEGDENSANYDSEEGRGSPDPQSTTPSASATRDELNSSMGMSSRFGDNLTRIKLPNNQSIVVATSDEMTVLEVLEIVCDKRQLVLSDSFIRIKTRDNSSSNEYTIPTLDDVFEKLPINRDDDDQDYDRVEVCNKLIFQLDMTRPSIDKWAGFGVELGAELDEEAETEDELRVFIDSVEAESPAQEAGLIPGDELLTLNGQVVSELDIEHIESVLSKELHIRITVRSCRLKKPDNTISSVLTSHADSYIDNMMCPPPPSQNRISDRIIDDLIVPAPNWVQNSLGEREEDGDPNLTPRTEAEKHNTDIKDLLQSAEQVTHLCRMAHERLEGEETHPVILPAAQPLSEAQRLRKIILELINTERTYVRDLSMLMERYLEPLKEETFLSSDEVVRLVGNIQQIVHFQKEFLRNLEEAVDDESFVLYTAAHEFKKILFSIAGSFMYYANHFKLYSSFCASHSRAQKVLSPGDNSELYEFLHARNPKQQHSATLESYLIKPIQRILKYPLLLTQLRSLTLPDSSEYTHLNDALKAMESVAEHINEMQKIYEEFGTVFDDIMRSHTHKQIHTGNGTTTGVDKRKLELNVGDLQFYGEADWLNAYDDISKPRKGWEHITTIFVFKHGVVLLCQEKLKGKPGKYKSGTARGVVLDSGPETIYTKFLPVTEIQVRTLPTTHARGPVALWELLHLKSTSESRPEKIFHMACSNVEKRSEFLKYMRQIIRESVRRMTVPKSKTSTVPTDSVQMRLRHSHIEQTTSRHSVIDSVPPHHTRLSTLSADYTTDPSAVNNPSSYAHTSHQIPHHTSHRLTDNRYSMNLDSDKLTLPDLDTQGGRSRTYGDLLDLTDSTMLNHCSKTSVGSDGGSAARLVYSSQDPIAYNSRSSLDNNNSNTTTRPQSPVWQRRGSTDYEEGDNSPSLTVSAPVDMSNYPPPVSAPAVSSEGVVMRRSLKIHEVYMNTATEC